jgi:hypothetical protein
VREFSRNDILQKRATRKRTTITRTHTPTHREEERCVCCVYCILCTVRIPTPPKFLLDLFNLFSVIYLEGVMGGDGGVIANQRKFVRGCRDGDEAKVRRCLYFNV